MAVRSIWPPPSYLLPSSVSIQHTITTQHNNLSRRFFEVTWYPTLMSDFIRSVKCAAVYSQLIPALTLAGQLGFSGLELHALESLYQFPAEERAKAVVSSWATVGKPDITHLCVHMPLPDRLDTIDALRYDLGSPEGVYVEGLILDSMDEGGMVAQAIGATQLYFNIHLLGLMQEGQDPGSMRARRGMRARKALGDLVSAASYCASRYGVPASIVRENNPPDHGGMQGVLDLDPRDMLDSPGDVLLNIDLAHFRMYEHARTGEMRRCARHPSAPRSYLTPTMSRYPECWAGCVLQVIAPRLGIIHISDASGPTKADEGLPIGQGDAPFTSWLEILGKGIVRDVMAVYEFKNGHDDWGLTRDADQRLAKVLGARSYRTA